MNDILLTSKVQNYFHANQLPFIVLESQISFNHSFCQPANMFSHLTSLAISLRVNVNLTCPHALFFLSETMMVLFVGSLNNILLGGPKETNKSNKLNWKNFDLLSNVSWD